MKALFLTNEYPPTIYGGAGVHVEYLSRELARLMEVEVRCFGNQNYADGQLAARGFGLSTEAYTNPAKLNSVFGALQRCLDFNTTNIDADVVHCHTWYSHFGGILAKLNYGIPLVVTVHSLEPLRPWKREQLGGGYDFTCWLEKTALEMADAVVAVSEGTRQDVMDLFNVEPAKMHIIYNGIDPEEYQGFAFGMGIDKANIRAVFHYNLPKSVENYAQEIGRAGRDGAPAHCEILAAAEDLTVLENFTYGDTPTPEALRDLLEELLAGRPVGAAFGVDVHPGHLLIPAPRPPGPVTGSRPTKRAGLHFSNSLSEPA